ncbi:molybdate ABC transporter substrate-binding protein [Prolixibacter bellariivorans]|uniref:Molybdate ABC transporter substrate-binding protein n=1 Tax=Prolixibacter bellariivorans TaxID=314319 RepID=A0A5M4AW73_9BACT|nr:molybdate ABC transporter substrate-binding protein [Prolixibacter bellariivorans]GET31898.1 molybdate ABC transporter substrate-binding protein [Prolixibacter bellariivorans]
MRLSTGLISFILILLFSCQSKTGKENLSEKSEQKISVFAAASLADVMSKLAKEYQTKSGVKVALNFASSGTLARQMQEGATPGIYLSASPRWMKFACQDGSADSTVCFPVARNSLVAVVPTNSRIDTLPISPTLDFPNSFNGRLAIGDPAHVPAGQYAAEALKSLGCFKLLQPRFLKTKDVRSALMVVELGECEMGIVYATDAMKSKKVRAVGVFPESLHQPIEYWAAKGKHGGSTADSLLKYLHSAEADYIWKKFGFKTIAEPRKSVTNK